MNTRRGTILYIYFRRWSMCWTSMGLVFSSCNGQESFSSPEPQECKWGLFSLLSSGHRALSRPKIKWLGHEGNHSLPYSAEVKDVWSYTSILPYVFITAISIPLFPVMCNPNSLTVRADLLALIFLKSHAWSQPTPRIYQLTCGVIPPFFDTYSWRQFLSRFPIDVQPKQPNSKSILTSLNIHEVPLMISTIATNLPADQACS
jgi:hypothetical protein